MITVREKKFIPYNNITEGDKTVYNSITVYNKLFSDDSLEKIKESSEKNQPLTLKCLSINFTLLTDRYLTEKKSESGIIACLLFNDQNIEASRMQKDSDSFLQDKNIKKLVKKGSIVVIGENFRKRWNYILPCGLIFYEHNTLPSIYSKVETRLAFSKKIKNSLSFMDKIPDWERCIQDHINLDVIGKGSYASVFRTRYEKYYYAVKISKIPDKYTKTDVSNSKEIYIMEKIIKPLIENKICPNLPLISSYGGCEKDKNNYITTELANGTLKEYIVRETPSDEYLENCLFQCMAGLHSIQHHAQIVNYDVKKDNVLYYNIIPGGYWCYIIFGKKYYVKNFGKLFILNDFGVSYSTDPSLSCIIKKNDICRLGLRYATIKNKKFIPIEVEKYKEISSKQNKVINAKKIDWKDGQVSHGAEFFMEDGKIVPVEIKKGKLDFSINTPPFDFYNDTQDAIRMFLGGKRTTQKGDHRKLDIPDGFRKKLTPYVGEGESAKNRIFDRPALTLAGHFIEDFFKNYSEIPKKSFLIETYKIS